MRHVFYSRGSPVPVTLTSTLSVTSSELVIWAKACSQFTLSAGCCQFEGFSGEHGKVAQPFKNLPAGLVFPLCHFSVICHHKCRRQGLRRGTLHDTKGSLFVCGEYYVFNRIFSVCPLTYVRVCVCPLFLRPHANNPPLFPVPDPAPFISVSLLRVSLCSESNLALMQSAGKVCVCVFKRVCCHRYK